MRKLFLLVFLLFSFTNCSKDHTFDCLKSTGDEITEIRNAASFTKLNLHDDVDIILYSDTTPFIIVTAGEHLINGIITEVENGILYIRNENKCNWVRSFKNKYTVKVGMRDPEHIAIYESGNITCADTIRTNNFIFDSENASGSFYLLFNNQETHINNGIGRADFHAAGRSNVVLAYLNDIATLDFSELKTELFYITSSTTGDCKINVEKELQATLKYTGDVYYSGNPYRVDESATGSGRLIHY